MTGRTFVRTEPEWMRATWTTVGKKFVARKPAGFHNYYEEAIACMHRDVSVCNKCIATYANIVECSGEWYWVRNEQEWLEFVLSLEAKEVFATN